MTEDTPPPQAPPQQTAPPPPHQPEADATTRSERPPLERSRDRRLVAGVCGGLGRHLDIDPVVFRVVLAVLCVSGGVGLFIYGLAWLIVPVEGTGRNELQRLLSGRVDGQSLGAVLVTVLGTGVFFSYMGSSNHIFPLLLIGLLAFAALRYDPAKHPRRRQHPAGGPEDGRPGAVGDAGSTSGFEATVFGVNFRSSRVGSTSAQPTAPIPAPAPAWWQRPDPLDKDPLGKDPLSKDPLGVSDTVPHPPLPPLPPPPAPFPPAAAPRRREHSLLGTLFFFLAVVTSGVVWFVQARHHHGVDLLAVLASGLLVMGIGLLIGAGWGRARSLVLWATLLTLAVAAVGASPVRLGGAVERTVWTPANAAALQPRYVAGAGRVTLDLSHLTLGAGGSAATRVELGAGQLVVILPQPGGPEIRITAHSGLGDIRLPDDSVSGGVSTDRTVDLNPGAAAAHGTVSLDLSVGAGEVEVNQ